MSECIVSDELLRSIVSDGVKAFFKLYPFKEVSREYVKHALEDFIVKVQKEPSGGTRTLFYFKKHEYND